MHHLTSVSVCPRVAACVGHAIEFNVQWGAFEFNVGGGGTNFDKGGVGRE